MIHERLDIQRWKAMFPLARLREEMQREGRERWRLKRTDEPTPDRLANWQPGGDSITSPYHIAVIEQLRDEILHDAETLQRVPTDVFVFAQGEAPRREMTKIGGLPLRAAGKAWPTFQERPMNFIAQFCFADSRDIVPQLPGDVLLVFGDDECIEWTDDDETAMAFEWVHLGETNLVGPQEIPAAGWSLTPYYGAIHRTFDYPDATDRFEPLSQPWQIAVPEAMKIGGAPAWVQPPAELPGNFLCAVNSIMPKQDQPFPFLNVPEAITGHLTPGSTYQQHNWDGDLMWGDAGDLYLFMEPDGKIHWTIQYG